MANFDGDNSANRIKGTNRRDLIRGFGGDDVLRGGWGADRLFGEELGYYTYDGGADRLAGGGGDDTLVGGRGDDTILGGSGDDILFGADLDFYNDDMGNDRLYGGDGHDLLYGWLGDDVIRAGAGDDVVFGGPGDDVLNGGAGYDEIYFANGVYGQAISVNLRNTASAQDTGSGNDRLRGFESVFADNYYGAVTLVGNDRDNILMVAGNQDVTIRGREGDDTINVKIHVGLVGTSGEGARTIVLDGGNGNDTIHFESAGSDAPGGQYEDNLFARGGDGDDVFTILGVGMARIDAGIGNDVITLQAEGKEFLGDAKYRICLGEGSDTIVVLPVYPISDFRAVNAIKLLDFSPGENGDVIQLGAWLESIAIGWTGDNPFATGHLSLSQRGGDTKLLVDRDGAGGSEYAAETLLTFKSTRPEAFTAANFDGWQPGHSAAPSADAAIMATATPHPDSADWPASFSYA